MLENAKEYLEIINEIKAQITAARQRVILNANEELLMLYWNIGKLINENTAYGNKFIANLARDIKMDNPHLRGFSERNLYYMAKFASFYKDLEILQQVAAKLSWRHHQTLLNRVKDYNEMLWYAKETLKNGWSSNILDMQIERGLYKRQAITDKTTNFKNKLPELQFLLELGNGFSFVGQQYHLEIAQKDFYIDLLFYNLKLRCYIVIELKMKEFKPEYAGKLNFYVSAVDDILKQSTDNPTIGMLLCRKKNKLIAEYALKDIDKPISVNEFKLLDKLPEKYAEILPTAEDIEKRLKLPGLE